MRTLLPLVLLAGCGEPALCRRDVALTIETALTITADVDLESAGVQTPISVATTMGTGQTVHLDVMDDTGTIIDTLSAITDVAGVASFGPVTVPTPRASLRAAATNLCGEDTSTASLDVLAGAHCELTLASPAVSIPRYAPLPVFNVSTDVDDTLDGEQVDITVAARVGWTVEIRERSPVHGDELMSTMQQPSLATTIPVTLRDGNTDVFATCRSGTVSLTSAAVFAFVDATPPTCTLQVDDPIDATAGPVTLIGHSSDPDVDGEPATITIFPVGTGLAFDAGASPMMNGTSHGSAVIDASQVDIRFITQDHAGNACAVTKRFDVLH